MEATWAAGGARGVWGPQVGPRVTAARRAGRGCAVRCGAGGRAGRCSAARALRSATGSVQGSAGQGSAKGGVRCSITGSMQCTAMGSMQCSATGVQGHGALWGMHSVCHRGCGVVVCGRARQRCRGVMSLLRRMCSAAQCRCHGRVQCGAVVQYGAMGGYSVVPQAMQLSVGLCSAVTGGCSATAGAGSVWGHVQCRRGRVQCTAVGACSATGGHRAQCRGCSAMPCAHEWGGAV